MSVKSVLTSRKSLKVALGKIAVRQGKTGNLKMKFGWDPDVTLRVHWIADTLTPLDSNLYQPVGKARKMSILISLINS